jgi:hypothetical protein
MSETCPHSFASKRFSRLLGLGTRHLPYGKKTRRACWASAFPGVRDYKDVTCPWQVRFMPSGHLSC